MDKAVILRELWQLDQRVRELENEHADGALDTANRLKHLRDAIGDLRDRIRAEPQQP